MDEPQPAVEHNLAGHRRGVSTPAFRRLWWAWTVSLCGDGIRALALPLYVAIQTKDPLSASAVVAAEVLPWLLLALPAGAIVDRARPKPVLITAHLVRAVFTGAIVVAIVTDNASVLLLCVFAFILTAAETFAYPASQVLMVELAGPDELDRANSRFFSVHTIGLNLVGPLAAGSLFVIEPAITFAVDGASFLIAALLIVGLPNIGPKAAKIVGDAQHGIRRLGGEVRTGLRMLFSAPGLRALVFMVAAGTMAISAVNAMLPLYAIQRLDMSPALISTLLIVMALGTLLANQIVPWIARRWSDGPVMVISMLLVGAGMCVIGYPHIAAAWVGNAVMGLGLGGWNVLSAARRQRLTPEGAMGRVSGAYRVVAWGLMPVGAGLAGPLAIATNLSVVFVVSGLFVGLVLMILAGPLLRTGASIPAQRTGTAGGSSVPAAGASAAAAASAVDPAPSTPGPASAPTPAPLPHNSNSHPHQNHHEPSNSTPQASRASRRTGQ